MPRNEIEIPNCIEHLTILDEDGKLDSELEPQIPDEILLKLYRYMLLGRRFDERMLNLQRQGRLGTFPPTSGQEAAHLGAVAVLKPSDWLVPAFRETAAELWRGRTMENVLLYYNGFNEGAYVPEGQNIMPISVPVGTQILHAVGIAWGLKYDRSENIVLTFFGDGATSEGDFHEAINFAGVFQLPVVFICQNNQWAISHPRSKQTRSQTIAQKALAYGIRGVQVDGNDVLAVYSATSEAAERARNSVEPTLIECVTYRMTVHTTADDPKRYRADEEVEQWRRRDPLLRYRKYLSQKGLFNEDTISRMDEEVKTEIQTAVEQAEKQMKTLGDPLDMFKNTYAKLPPHLVEQKEELERNLAEDREE